MRYMSVSLYDVPRATAHSQNGRHWVKLCNGDVGEVTFSAESHAHAKQIAAAINGDVPFVEADISEPRRARLEVVA